MNSPQSAEALAVRYGNATDPALAQGDRLLRYAHAVLDAFPGEDDERPAKCLRHWRTHFHRYAEELKQEIAAWYADRTKHRTLTALLWHVGAAIHERGEGMQLIDFNEHRQTLYLRTGLLELAKLLCREVEAERASESESESETIL